MLGIPLMAMVTPPQEYIKLSPEEAFRELSECVEPCRIVGGVFSLLWHNTRFIGRGYGGIYCRLLNELAGGDGYVWRVSCDGSFWY